MFIIFRIWHFDLVANTGCLKKHGNSETNSISALLWISIVVPNFKSLNIIMSATARVYFMERVNGCKDVSIMSPQDEQWRRTSLLCLYSAIFLFYKQNVNIADETHTDYSFLSRYHYTKSKNYSKRRYRIRHWISMFIGTLCSRSRPKLLYNKINNRKILLISSFAVSRWNENKLSFVYVSPKIAVHFTVV